MTQIPVAGQDRPCGLRERKKPAGLKPAAAFRAALREVAGSFSEAGLPL
jgi:hypothetical protein